MTAVLSPIGKPIGNVWHDTSEAEDAASVTPVDYSVPSYPVDPARYYDGDLADAMNAAILVCQELTAPWFRMTMSGSLGSESITFDLPNFSTIEILGSLSSSVTAGPCIRIGSTTAQRFGYFVRINAVERTAVDTTNGSIGVEYRNLNTSTFLGPRWAVNFETGVRLYGDAGSGVVAGLSECVVVLGFIHDNQINLLLDADNDGYCNENHVVSGSLGHSSTYNGGDYADTFGLFIVDHTNSLNNNRFYSLCLQSTSGAGVGVAAFIEGQNNVLYSPRLENPNDANFEIEFGSNSINCGIIGRGFGVGPANITDNGTQNFYDTTAGRTLISAATAAAGQSVHAAQSVNTSAAKCYTARDSSGNDTAWFLGTGEAEFLFPTSTTAALEAIGNAINTTGKRTGKLVINTTSNKLVRSQGAAAGSTWISVDGATTHTPV